MTKSLLQFFGMSENKYHLPQIINGVSFADIHNRFAQTQYGMILKQNPRWSSYKPDGLPLSEWQHALGIDVNNFDHLMLSLRLTQSFLVSCENPYSKWAGSTSADAQFSSDEAELLCLGSLIHDWGEAIVGDIPEPLKGQQDSDEELVVLQNIVNKFCITDDIDHLQGVMRTAIEEVLMNEGSKLWKAFNAIEKAGYVRTACNAWRKHKSGRYKYCDASLYALATQSIPRHVQQITHYATIYPPIHEFAHHPLIAGSIVEVMKISKRQGN